MTNPEKRPTYERLPQILKDRPKPWSLSEGESIVVRVIGGLQEAVTLLLAEALDNRKKISLMERRIAALERRSQTKKTIGRVPRIPAAYKMQK